jgi:hypothetical protein
VTASRGIGRGKGGGAPKGHRPRKALGKPGVWLRCLNDLDLRTRAAQHALALRDQLVGDAGGSDHITVATRELCQRASVMGAMAGDMETAWLSGDEIDFGRYVQVATVQRRILNDLGLRHRVAKDVSLLESYLQKKRDVDAEIVTAELDPPAQPFGGPPTAPVGTDIEPASLSPQDSDRGAPQHSQNSENEDSAE